MKKYLIVSGLSILIMAAPLAAQMRGGMRGGSPGGAAHSGMGGTRWQGGMRGSGGATWGAGRGDTTRQQDRTRSRDRNQDRDRKQDRTGNQGNPQAGTNAPGESGTLERRSISRGTWLSQSSARVTIPATRPLPDRTCG